MRYLLAAGLVMAVCRYWSLRTRHELYESAWRVRYKTLQDHAIRQSDLLGRYAKAEAQRQLSHNPDWIELDMELTKSALDREVRAKEALAAFMRSYGCSRAEIAGVLESIDAE